MASITGFLQARLDEEEQSAELFHELACPAGACSDDPQVRAAARYLWCDCECPRRLLEQIAVKRQIMHCHEQQLCYSGPPAPDWLCGMISVRQVLGALALPYELHPAWQEAWRP